MIKLTPKQLADMLHVDPRLVRRVMRKLNPGDHPKGANWIIDIDIK